MEHPHTPLMWSPEYPNNLSFDLCYSWYTLMTSLHWPSLKAVNCLSMQMTCYSIKPSPRLHIMLNSNKTWIWFTELKHPYTAKDTQTLEKVQQFGLRICTRHWNSSYQDLLDIFQLPSLENRRLFLSLSTFLYHNLIYYPVNGHPTPLSSSLKYNHNQQYSIPFARTNHFKYSFYLTLSLYGIIYL